MQPHHIIAIGASAGGLEEINLFFDHTPLDGVSYVIVQHLSQDFKSRMVELLARHSKLVVKEAENAMKVASNVVYLIPNDKFMTIKNSRLYLTDKGNAKGPHLTINKFFNSLAEDHGDKAIGIILSGLGSDGTEGVKAIKQAGGMVIARNPATSEFGSMPSNAIATGLVDFVLEPERMPDTIEDYVKQEADALTENEEDEKNMSEIIDLIKAHSPLDFTDYKKNTILRRIKRRAAYKSFNSLADYIHCLKDTPEELDILAKDFLISVTAFFRDSEAFQFIEKKIVPEILEKHKPDEEIKLWVAGCATGEEAYSFAILLCEQLTGKLKDTVVKIFATDIDNAALKFAGVGLYTAAIEKDVSAERLGKYFIKENDQYRITPEIRKMVIFAQHDVIKNAPYCNMDFISCRNLLIYMTPALQKKIFLLLLFGLKKHGFLFLGSSENPMPIIENLEILNKKWKIYRNHQEKREIKFDAFSMPDLIDIKRGPYLSANRDTISNSDALAEIVNTSLVRELNCLLICVDEHNQVLKTYGDTTKYLLQKNFNTNLAELLPRPLAVAFNALSIKAKKAEEKVRTSGIKITHGDSDLFLNLSVELLVNRKTAERIFLISISEEIISSGELRNDVVYDEKIYHDEYTKNLEEEIYELKDKLRTAYENLDASNENMQSFNEELLSSNEEMQSTNEEMQSVNEELHTINADYQLKNKELLEINDDLNNYFRSNINGQLFVNSDLLLMKFSPGTVKQINLLPTDVGRPLSNISTNIKFETIIEDIKKVLAEEIVITREIETTNNKWYQVMTMPYVQTRENKMTGAIVTFNDITELKITQHNLDRKNASLMRINADLDNFVHTASHDLLAPLANIETSISVMNDFPDVDPKLKTFLDVINNSVRKFRGLITDIATIAKVEHDMDSMETVRLNEILNDVEWALNDKIRSAGAVISRDLEVKNIQFSKKNLRSILYNLISNAIKFRGDKKPQIKVSTALENDKIILCVQDNGIGIAKADQEKIFDMYGRLRLDVEGQGIGLYLARKIVHAAEGNILVESEPGKGTKFIVQLKAPLVPVVISQ